MKHNLIIDNTAFPIFTTSIDSYQNPEIDIPRHLGLTKLEFFASLAMQALMQRDHAITDTTCAAKSVHFARALMNEIEKENKKIKKEELNLD